ncbi:MAG: flagellar hook-associated protein FlgL [Burkholderiaceae bacterium]|nr:flagellar hook-associated protein FlgL [Burkholderiaceae bacterium]
MRIATAFYHQQSIQTISERSEAMARLQEQLATGKRINRASDDPVGAAEAERLRAAGARIEIEQRMMAHASGMLSLADGSLAAASDALQGARELLIGAGNSTLQAADRASIATQLQGLRDELLAIGNQRDGSGGYVFAAQGSTTPPFTTGGAPAFQPAAGTRQTGLDVSFDTTVDGGAVFIGDGSSAPGGSVFGSLDAIIAQLNDPAVDPAALGAGLQNAMAAVDTTLDRVLQARTSVGEQLRALESRGRLLESGELSVAARASDITATDYAAAVSDMQTNQLAIEAAMRTYAQISRLSLFNYL